MNNFITQMQGSFQHAPLLGQTESWLQTLRKQNMEQFVAMGLPTRKQENWKYTPVYDLSQHVFNRSGEVDVSIKAMKQYYLDCYTVVLVNGKINLSLSSLTGLPKEVTVLSLNEALKNDRYKIKDYFNLEHLDNFQQFALLNTALLTSGIYIEIPAKTELKKPLRLLNISQAKTTDMNHSRHIIILNEGVNADIIEEYQALDGNVYFNNIVSKYILKSNANLRYTKLQNESSAAYHIANTEFLCEEKSVVKTFHLGLGGKLAREDVNYDLNQSKASCILRGLYLPRKDQLIDYHTSINHKVSETYSDEYFKGIVGDKGTAVFNGRVWVVEDAQKIEADQSNKNLLLSKNAEINTKPELEIYADDVKCSHGATVGQLDEKALFYLRTRGIEKNMAEKMLIEAFYEEILASQNVSLREYCEKFIRIE